MEQDHEMQRRRITITVDEGILIEARALHEGVPDASLVDAALRAFARREREAALDAAYSAAYAEHPFDEPDEWGDLASFGDVASRT